VARLTGRANPGGGSFGRTPVPSGGEIDVASIAEAAISIVAGASLTRPVPVGGVARAEAT
jgi:hypothetical protein